MAKFELLSFIDLARMGVEKKASDIHLTVMRPPTLRINGQLVSLDEYPKLAPADTYKFGRELMADEKIFRQIDEQGHADFSLSLSGEGL